MGAIVEHVGFQGKAYKAPPESPLALSQLRPESAVKQPLVKDAADKPPTTCIEAWAGKAVITTELVRSDLRAELTRALQTEQRTCQRETWRGQKTKDKSRTSLRRGKRIACTWLQIVPPGGPSRISTRPAVLPIAQKETDALNTS